MSISYYFFLCRKVELAFLGRNNIIRIPEKSIKRLTRLRHLALHQNKIEDSGVPLNVFLECFSMKVLIAIHKVNVCHCFLKNCKGSRYEQQYIEKSSEISPAKCWVFILSRKHDKKHFFKRIRLFSLLKRYSTSTAYQIYQKMTAFSRYFLKKQPTHASHYPDECFPPTEISYYRRHFLE